MSVQINDLTEETTPNTTDVLYLVHDAATTPLARKVTVANLLGSAPPQDHASLHDYDGGDPLTSCWDDLVIPATIVDLTGPAAPPAYDNAEQTIDFSASLVNTIQMNFQMPHARVPNSNALFHVHYMPSNTDTGDIYWEIKYRWLNDGDVAGGWTTTNVTNTASGVQNKLAMGAAVTMIGTGKTISSILQVQLQRMGNDGTNDTFTGLAKVLSVDCHVQRDGLGSKNTTSR